MLSLVILQALQVNCLYFTDSSVRRLACPANMSELVILK